MRIAVFTDAHANLPAIQAALAAIKANGCDALIHTGDAPLALAFRQRQVPEQEFIRKVFFGGRF